VRKTSTSLSLEFVAERDNICALSLRGLSLQFASAGVLRLRLSDLGASDEALAVFDLDLSKDIMSDWVLFSFNPLCHSKGRRYFLSVELLNAPPDPSVPFLRPPADDPHAQVRNKSGVQDAAMFQVHSLLRFRYAALSRAVTGQHLLEE
jgi:hypothetical protein